MDYQSGHWLELCSSSLRWDCAQVFITNQNDTRMMSLNNSLLCAYYTQAAYKCFSEHTVVHHWSKVRRPYMLKMLYFVLSFGLNRLWIYITSRPLLPVCLFFVVTKAIQNLHSAVIRWNILSISQSFSLKTMLYDTVCCAMSSAVCCNVIQMLLNH